MRKHKQVRMPFQQAVMVRVFRSRAAVSVLNLEGGVTERLQHFLQEHGRV